MTESNAGHLRVPLIGFNHPTWEGNMPQHRGGYYRKRKSQNRYNASFGWCRVEVWSDVKDYESGQDAEFTFARIRPTAAECRELVDEVQEGLCD